jgi:hypothetical protein
MLPFTREQFIAVFVAYNESVWPAQFLAYVVGLGIVLAILRRIAASGRLVAGGLALMWAWTGAAYHLMHFAAINRAAVAFGALFLVQAALFVHAGVVNDRLRFGKPRGTGSWLGWALVAYAMLLYPLVGAAGGHRLAELPLFGVTPCPVTLFTFGVLLLSTSPVPRWLLVIPVLWSLVGGSAAFMLGIPQDWPLLFSGIAAVLIVLRDRRRPASG